MEDPFDDIFEGLNTPTGGNTYEHDPSTVSVEEFTKYADFFKIKVRHSGKHYTVDLSSLFEDMIYPDHIDLIGAERIISLISGLREELAVILDDLQYELDNTTKLYELFMAAATEKAEASIREEREKLIAQKIKKEIGMITAAQVQNWIINNYAEADIETQHSMSFHEYTDNINYLKRQINLITRTDQILSQRAYFLNEFANRHKKENN
jgi:hypothetical protein